MTSTEKWPANSTARRSVASLVPYARNARTHAAEQVAQIAASITEWGWTTPVLIDGDDGIIAGHGRILAAQLLNIVDVPVIVASGWTEAQKRAYIIADNQLTINGAWDEDLLRVELDDLRSKDFDIDLLGFSGEELESIAENPDFEPGTEDDQGQLDTLAPKIVICPSCGESFDSREQD